jgi:RNA polymerase sigma-70 factor (ECF subfamily)
MAKKANQRTEMKQAAVSAGPPRSLSVEELVRRCRDGCEQSFAEVVRRYSPRLLAFLLQKTHNAHDAEDLVQETFIKAYENIHRYNSRWKFSTWLFTIAARLAAGHHRRRKDLHGVGDVATDALNPADLAGRREARQNLWLLAASLSPNQYEALWLRYVQEMSIKEIAKVLSKSQVNVKVLLYRAKTNLIKKAQGASRQEQELGSAVRSERKLSFFRAKDAQCSAGSSD